MGTESSAQVGALLQETAPLVEEALALFRADESTWVMAFRDEAAVELHADLERQKLTLSMLVGQVDESQSLAMLRVLMLANGLWRETGGLRFALDAEGTGVEQCFELVLDELEAGRLARALVDFADRGRGWAELLATPDVFDSPEMEEHFDTLLSTGVRV